MTSESPSIPLTDLQKRTAQDIVNIFETGSATGDYGCVTLIPGDTGHLTYGRSQTTLASGNLYLLIQSYCGAADSAFAGALRNWLARLQARDLTLDTDPQFRGALREAGTDPAMHAVQNAFFDRAHWTPAAHAALALGMKLALSYTVVYDSHVHGAWQRVRDRVANVPDGADRANEQEWIQQYVNCRRDYLLSGEPPLPETTYRTATFQHLIDQGKWGLPLPLTIRGVTVDSSIGDDAVAHPVSAEPQGQRILRLVQPNLTGDDVRTLQRGLSARGFANAEDGVFGPATDATLRKFQQAAGLTVDGIAGPATRAALGL